MKKTLSLLLVSIIAVSAVFAFALNTAAAQFRAVSGKYNYTYAAQVLELVNKERADNGLKALTMTQPLTDGAMIRAAETTVSFSHTRPNGEQCFTAFEWSRAAGENIAYGQRTPEQVVTAWMNSSGHRANILNSSFTTIGIGCFEYGGTYYWSQAFSGGSGASYNPSGSKGVTVNVSMTSGVSSYIETAQTTRPAEMQTNESTTRPTTSKPAATTTVKPSTTKAQTTRQNTNNKKTGVYARLRSVILRYRYYFK